MADKQHPKTPSDITPVYETQAISDVKKKMAKSKVSIPPESSIKEAKDWVDFNEK